MQRYGETIPSVPIAPECVGDDTHNYSTSWEDIAASGAHSRFKYVRKKRIEYRTANGPGILI
jgi:hypothetical protein